jgi:hypothetical protein
MSAPLTESFLWLVLYFEIFLIFLFFAKLVNWLSRVVGSSGKAIKSSNHDCNYERNLLD